MSSRTSAQVRADLTEAYAARLAALTGQSYSVNTGQGTQSVTRPNLTEINKTISLLEAELEECLARERGDSGIVSVQFRRHG